MAKCIYILSGRSFSSELELNNFLLNNKHSIEFGKVSDIIFSTNSKRNEVIAILDEKLQWAAKIQSIKRNPDAFLDDEDIDPESIKPYMGVTSALRKFKQADGRKKFVPTFEIDNYKIRCLDRWEKDGFKQSEADLVGREAGIPIKGKEAEAAFEALVVKWGLLGKVGTSLHRVSELFWQGESLSTIAKDPEVDNYLNPVSVSQMYSNMEILRNQLIKLHGGGDPTQVKFYPEYVVAGDTMAVDDNDKPIKLLGIVDLLVVDSSGRVHIYDYKTSDKGHSAWDSTKSMTFDYQLGIYRQLLEQYGISVNQSMLGIIPFSMNKFDGTSGTFSDITAPTTSIGGNIEINIDYRDRTPGLSYDSSSAYITNNIESIMPIDPVEDIITSDFMDKVANNFTKLFPDYKFNRQLNEKTLEALKKDVRFNTSTGKWTLPDLKHRGKTLAFDTQAEAYAALEEYHGRLLNTKVRETERVIGNIKTAIETGDTTFLPVSNAKIAGYSAGWFLKECGRYCNPEWKVMDVPELTSLGIMLLYNKRAKYYDAVVIDNTPVATPLKFKKGSTVIGEFASDVELKQRGIPALHGDAGNINLLKAMIALNELPDLFRDGKVKLGEVRVVNQREETGRHTSMWQLRKNIDELFTRTKIENNFKGGKIQSLESYQLAYYSMLQYAAISNKHNVKLNKIVSEFENNPILVNHSEENLIRLQKMLELEYPNLRELKTMDESSPPGIVYGYISKALKELRGIHYVQELKDYNKVVLMIGNPDVMESENIRNIYKLTTDGLVHLRHNLGNFGADMRNAIEKYMKAKGYSSGRRNLVGDQKSLFNHLFVRDTDGKVDKSMKLKSPLHDTTLDAADKEFLTFWLDRVNRYRFPNTSTAELNELKSDPYSVYYEVPLIEASSATKLLEGGRGVTSWVKRKFDQFRHPVREFDKAVQGSFNKDHVNQLREDSEKYEMVDRFEYSEDPIARKELLEEHDTIFFETNLYDIAFTYAGVKERKIAYDNILPIIKATMVEMLLEANFQNIDMKNTMGYLKDFVKNKIIGEAVISEQLKGASQYFSMIRNFTTMAALAFSPKAGVFQLMEGFWKNMGKSIIRPMGVNQFGWTEVQQAMKWVIGDTKDHFKIVSLGELLNEQYAINDQDSNRYAERMMGSPGFLNFQSKAMTTTTAPDYFNRMTLFIAQMIKDGCMDAYSMKDNRLIYNWKKDKRFSIYASGNTANPKYLQQKALYMTMIDEFRKEGWKGKEGQPIGYDDDLPLAYTNREAQSLKSFADQTFGYYTHETQWMLKSYFLGAQYTQFRTYWSSLKNRYILKGGTYSQGSWVHLEDSAGVKMYKKYDKNLGSYIMTEENTGIPYYVWKGSWQEGIFISMRDGFMETLEGYKDNGAAGALKGLKGFWNPADQELSRVRHANMQQFAYDLALWAIIGTLVGQFLIQLLRDQAKEDKGKNLSFGEIMLRDAESIFVTSLITSTEDLGAFTPLLSPMVDWTPPALRMITNIWNDGCAVITGDKDFGKAVINNIGVLRQTKNFWYDANEALDEMME